MADQEIPLLGPSFFRTLFFVAIAALAMVVIDSVLAKTERDETAQAAARFYREGEQLMQQHKYSDAADAFRSAIANARENKEYPLALGQALLAAGQLDEASTTLTDLLAADSMAGAPNLAMARVYAKEDQFEQAAFYYHRAIYGQWPKGDSDSQVKVRFELADLLDGRDSKAQLLAELLPLQDEASGDPATQEKLGRLFLTAGSPARAVAIFRDLVRSDPENADAQEGLGEAEMDAGDCASARSAFNAAIRLRPDYAKARTSLGVCEQVLDTDPLRRGIDGQEKFTRSAHLLQTITERTGQCPALSALQDAARTALAQDVKPPDQTAMSENDLDLAAKLWRAKQSECHLPVSPDDESIDLIISKVTR